MTTLTKLLIITALITLSALIFIVYLLIINNRKNKHISELLEKTILSDNTLLERALTSKAMGIGLWSKDLSNIHISNVDSLLNSDFPMTYTQEFRNNLGYANTKDFPNLFSAWVKSIHPDDTGYALNAIFSHLKDYSGNTPLKTEYRMKTKTGEYRYFKMSGETLRDETGRPLKIAGAIKDVTAETLAARDLAEAQKQKQASISTLESILNSIDAMIYVSVPDTGELLFINKTMKKLFKIENDDLTGKYCYKVFRGRDAICDFCPCFRLNEAPDSTIVWEEYDEAVGINVLHSDCYINWPDGRTVHLQNAMDITELVNSKMAEEKSRAASEAKSQFLANVSHEIRTPMNSIVGFAELACDYDVPAEVKDYLDKILDNSQHLLAIINDILDISKIEANKAELDCIPFDIQEMLESCRNVIKPGADEKNITLLWNCDPYSGDKLMGDPVKLKQVILNILSNAVKFTNGGTVAFHANISDIGDGTAAFFFVVEDTGIGMNAEVLQKIFEPFTQANNSITREYGGTGLGLAISKRIVDMMGGTLDVESRPDAGSKFSVKLIFKIASGFTNYDNRFVSSGINPGSIRFGGDVLVCEDNEMNREVIKEQLGRFGITPVIVTDGKAGVDLISERLINGIKPFDLIFMDIYMPVMDGIAAAAKIKELGLETPIIALTADIMPESISEYEASGMSGYLSKPFMSQALCECLLKYLPSDNVSAPPPGILFNTLKVNKHKE